MLDLKELAILPGLYTVETDRGAKGRWKDGDKVRFRDGHAQKIGGWQKSGTTTFVGKCRKLFDWQTLAFEHYIGFGTSKKLYVWKGGTYYDVTPLRTSGVLGLNPFTTANGSAVVTVAHVGHGEMAGDYVHFSGAAAVNGITVDGEYAITEIVDADNYKVTHSSNAAGNGAGGGAAVAYQYEIHIGSDDSVAGLGWGASFYGASTYGTPRTLSNFLTQARTWSLDKWGEDLIACPRGGGIYLWDSSVGVATRAAVIAGAPTTARAILVSPENQHLVVLGAHDGVSDDPLLLDWSESEDYSVYTASATNSAGQKRFTTGNEILCGIKVRKEILVFTDSVLWAMRFVGGSAFFEFDPIGKHGALRGPNAVADANGVPYWMGEKDFFYYDGGIRRLPCDVWPTVFEDINFVQRFKTYAGYNQQFREVWWLYCSAASTEVDRYVIYNVEEKLWSFGTIARTAYIGDSEIFLVPYAAGANGYLYDHETGVDDDTSAMAARLKSGDVEIGSGNQLMLVTGIVPDYKRLTGSMTLDITGKNYPQKTETITEAQLTLTSTTPFANPRFKARQVSLNFQSAAVGDDWRMGTLRVAAKAYGKK